MELTLDIPDSAWTTTGDYLDDPRRRLIAHIVIAGTNMHLEAYEAHPRNDQDIDDQDIDDHLHLYDDDADTALSLFVGEGGFPKSTTTIGGREYVLVATPFA